jgi:hypothetical protein
MKIRLRSKTDMAYVAGALEARGRIFNSKQGLLGVEIRMRGQLPYKLFQKFGGTCFVNGRANWFRVTGRGAARFLGAVLPHLKSTKKQVAKMLGKE